MPLKEMKQKLKLKFWLVTEEKSTVAIQIFFKKLLIN